jgi:hypothetical protein
MGGTVPKAAVLLLAAGLAVGCSQPGANPFTVRVGVVLALTSGVAAAASSALRAPRWPRTT